MEDEDSGIFQSRIDDESLSENDIIKEEKTDVTSSQLEETLASESDDSDTDALSSLSDSNVSDSSSDDLTNGCYSHLLDYKESLNGNNNKFKSGRHDDGKPIPDGSPPSLMSQPSTEKKKLSVDDSFSNCYIQDLNILEEREFASSVFLGKSLKRNKSKNKEFGELHPGMKITYKDGERNEHWEFENGAVFENKQSHQCREDVNETSPKRILKLQLSALSSVSKDRMHQLFLTEMRLELRDQDKLQCSEWRRMFNGYHRIQISQLNVLQGRLDQDAVIIPGNSFGFLDGEPEIQYTKRFGWKLQEDVQKLIHDKYGGELLVGQALITSLRESDGHRTESRRLDGHNIRYAIYVPVMRVPLQVGDTVNAYLAFKAALKEVKRHNENTCNEAISTVLCPSLCNGFGSMPAGRIALQMKTAYDAVVTGSRLDILKPNDLGAMATNHVEMTTKIGNWC